MENKILYYINEVDRNIKGVFTVPLCVELDLSNRCMLKCEFCIFANLRSNVDFPLDIYKNLIPHLKDIGVKAITYTGGGEPLLNSNFNIMVDIALEYGFEVGLITNGVCLDMVEKPEVFTFIRISLDSATRETYFNVKGVDLFEKVITNARQITDKTTLGLSYAVYQNNRHELNAAQNLATEMGAAYIQFKPAWINGDQYNDYVTPLEDKVITTDRYKAKDNIPCFIAGLIGVIGADKCVYFCCQHRGNKKFNLGKLDTGSEFMNIWAKRKYFMPEVSKCPRCRYMNYAKSYLQAKNDLFFKHKNFL